MSAQFRLCRALHNRKNFLFVGNDAAGENLAGLYSLIATCEANGVNPVEYLADVLLRVQTHPASRLDELLPHRWKPPAAEPSA
jgi:transposase